MIYPAGTVLFCAPDDEQAPQDARDYIKKMGFPYHAVKITRRPRGEIFDVLVVARMDLGQVE